MQTMVQQMRYARILRALGDAATELTCRQVAAAVGKNPNDRHFRTALQELKRQGKIANRQVQVDVPGLTRNIAVYRPAGRPIDPDLNPLSAARVRMDRVEAALRRAGCEQLTAGLARAIGCKPRNINKELVKLVEEGRVLMRRVRYAREGRAGWTQAYRLPGMEADPDLVEPQVMLGRADHEEIQKNIAIERARKEAAGEYPRSRRPWRVPGVRAHVFRS